MHWNSAIEHYVMLLNRAKDEEYSQEGIYVSFSPRLDDPSLWTTPVKILNGGRWYPQVIGMTTGSGTDKLAAAVPRFFMQPTLASLARRLDPAEFFQVSRSAIIRLGAVKEAKPFSDGTGEILLANGQTMTVARRRWRLLLDRLEA